VGLRQRASGAWDFGHPGWVNERLTAHLVSPVKDALVVEALAWTPGTKGKMTALAYQMAPPAHPTEEQLAKYLLEIKSKVMGKMVLVGEHTVVPFEEKPPAKRREDAQVKEQYDPNNPDAGRGGRGGRGGQPEIPPGTMTAREVNAKVDLFLVANRAKVRVNDDARVGSQAYVKEHFGSFENPKPGYEKLDAYSIRIPARAGRAA